MGAWARFDKAVRDDIEYRMSLDNVIDAIDANGWAEVGAERYNFVDTAAGPRTMAELNKRLEHTRAEFMAGR